jgi:hypothetical protein
VTNPEYKILETVLAELRSIKVDMPNGELKQIIENQKEMKEDISDLKRTLLNPEDGVIVKVNKNTEFRRSFEGNTEKYNQLVKDLEDIKSWKSTVIKILWIIFGSLFTILTKLFFYSTTGKIV